MERLNFSEAGRAIKEYGSRGVRWTPLARSDSPCLVSLMRFEPGAVLGLHPTTGDQLFFVAEGSGWVRTAEGAWEPVNADDAVLWRAGEEHESGSDVGMTAIIAEASRLTAASG